MVTVSGSVPVSSLRTCCTGAEQSPSFTMVLHVTPCVLCVYPYSHEPVTKWFRDGASCHPFFGVCQSSSASIARSCSFCCCFSSFSAVRQHQSVLR